MRLHSRTAFRSGLVAFPFGQARGVLRGYAELLTDAPDELTADAGLLSAPDGSPMIVVLPTWSGEPAAGDAILDRVAALGSPVINTVATTTYPAAMRANDEVFSAKGHYAMGTRNVAELTPAAIDTLVELCQTRTSPGSLIYWHNFHGAASRVPSPTPPSACAATIS